jgi:hypothetical protein
MQIRTRGSYDLLTHACKLRIITSADRMNNSALLDLIIG